MKTEDCTSKYISAERLRELLHYDPDTGVFTWKLDRRGTAKKGDVAGCNDRSGYLIININSFPYKAHRLAWLFMFGVWPDITDHINGVKSDNRIANLRSVTPQGNTQNIRATRRSKTGLLGVHQSKSSINPFVASIYANGKAIHLGCYPTAESAHAAYVKAKRELHPFGTI